MGWNQMTSDSTGLKVSLSIGNASLNAEGDKEAVEQQTERFYAVFGKSADATGGEAATKEQAATAKAGRTGNRKGRRASGPSCASRIETLHAEGYFDAPRTPSEVTEKLRERATPYELKHVAAALFDVTQRGTLRRVQKDGAWIYVKP
jgi:hypothetical protein